MRAMILDAPRQPLRLAELPIPKPNEEQVLIRVHTCGVCRTDLHIVDGELTHPKLPLILGHQIVGTVKAMGNGVDKFSVGQRVGVPWLGYTCGDRCPYCLSGRENLCDYAEFTGYNILWEERVLRFVANLTRQDGEEFLALAPKVPIRTQANVFPLIQANEALDALRTGKIEGSAVLVID